MTTGTEPTPERLRQLWEQFDPVPAGLAERAGFALEVQALADLDLDLELMRLLEEQTEALGSRGDQVRTITFGSGSTTVMLALSDAAGGYRVDGWVAPGGRRRLEVRTAVGTTGLECDETGRFTVPLVPRGHFQLVLEGDEAVAGATGTSGTTGTTGDAGAAGAGRPTLVTPALTL